MHRPYLVLLICNEPNLRRSFVLILENAGYLISNAATLVMGRELMEKNKFDLIILGVHEPEITPAEISSELPQEQFSTPMLFLTESTPTASLTKRMLRGGRSYLTQPFTPAKFLKSVAKILSSKPIDLTRFENQTPDLTHPSTA